MVNDIIFAGDDLPEPSYHATSALGELLRLTTAMEPSDSDFIVDVEDSTVRVDPMVFRNILLPILSNAVKFNRPGSMIEITGRRSDRWLQMTIHDNGIGIQPEERDKVFDRLFQVDGT